MTANITGIQGKLVLKEAQDMKSGKAWLNKQSESVLWMLFKSHTEIDFTKAGNRIMAEKLSPLAIEDGYRKISESTWKNYRSQRTDLKWKAFDSTRKPKIKAKKFKIGDKVLWDGNAYEKDEDKPLFYEQGTIEVEISKFTPLYNFDYTILFQGTVLAVYEGQLNELIPKPDISISDILADQVDMPSIDMNELKKLAKSICYTECPHCLGLIALEVIAIAKPREEGIELDLNKNT